MGSFVKLVGAITVAFLIAQVVGENTARYAAEKGSARSAIRAAVEEGNKRLPLRLNDELMIIAQKLSQNAVQYSVQFVNYRASELDPAAMYSQIYRPQREAACAAREMSFFFENGYSVERLCYGSDGGFVTKIVIKPSDCGY